MKMSSIISEKITKFSIFFRAKWIVIFCKLRGEKYKESLRVSDSSIVMIRSAVHRYQIPVF